MGYKILICTVESWNSKVGANTFSTLFQNYPPEELANVYIREEIPDSSCCSRYFQIAESRVIKSVYRPGIQTGREVASCQQMTREDEENLTASRSLYNKNRKKRSVVKLLIRELLWKVGKWKTSELDAFLDSFQPDIIVFGMDGYIHLNRLCRYMIRHTGAKAVGYFWDDTFTYKQRRKQNYRLLRFFTRCSLKKLAKQTNAFWAITEKTKKEADAFFNIDCQVLTKPIDVLPDEKWIPYIPNKPLKMLYTGNLLIGRFESILAVSKALERINRDGLKIELDVYSASYIAPEDQKELSEYVHMKGVVSQEEVLQLQKQADVLLFAEAISGENSQIARLSFSTKLTDYLGNGKCILAIGAPDVAPMEYLKKEQAAICASSQDELHSSLQQLAQEPEQVLGWAQAAYECGKKNHNRSKIENIMKQTFDTIMH